VNQSTSGQVASINASHVFSTTLRGSDITPEFSGMLTSDTTGTGMLIVTDSFCLARENLSWTATKPSTNTPPMITSPATAEVPENTTDVMTVTATDADLPPQTVTFSIIGGADQDQFNLMPGGALTFKAAPDFEAPTDANGDKLYEVTVGADDGNGGTATRMISVTVTPVNDNNPVFTSVDIASVPENTTDVMTVTATDADLPAQIATFSIVGGVDQANFEIANGNMLSFISPPDYEGPIDADGNNVYVVIVQASDGNGGTTTQAINVTVTDVSERLPGDYNDSGTVDAADYVVWRKALDTMVAASTGADGNGDGNIDAADYDIWRANFGMSAAAGVGRTAIAQGQAAVITESAAPIGQFVMGRMTRAMQAPSYAIDSTSQSVESRSSSRPERRHSPVVVGSHDKALLAWLGAKPDGARRGILTAEFEGLADRFASRVHEDEAANTVDLAFAMPDV
jgi:dihydroxyacetone kinase DhaKLM complex PTS-EIIA-like component DhaM